jgi:hypothetical protein
MRKRYSLSFFNASSFGRAIGNPPVELYIPKYDCAGVGFTLTLQPHTATPKMRMQAMRAGAVEFLAKPFDDPVADSA